MQHTLSFDELTRLLGRHFADMEGIPSDVRYELKTHFVVVVPVSMDSDGNILKVLNDHIEIKSVTITIIREPDEPTENQG